MFCCWTSKRPQWTAHVPAPADGQAPIPAVICSTLTTEGSRIALEAMAAGSVGVVAKPRLGLRQFLEDSRRELLTSLKTAARSRTLAQDEPSCVVFGMPKEAIKLGAVDEVLPLDRVAGAILQFDARG